VSESIERLSRTVALSQAERRLRLATGWRGALISPELLVFNAADWVVEDVEGLGVLPPLGSRALRQHEAMRQAQEPGHEPTASTAPVSRGRSALSCSCWAVRSPGRRPGEPSVSTAIRELGMSMLTAARKPSKGASTAMHRRRGSTPFSAISGHL
jgi:hypothetical protein